MARHESVKPWTPDKRSERENWPRKGVYFIGMPMIEVYDFLIWLGSTKRYKTLEGKAATSMSEIVSDLIVQEYLRQVMHDDVVDAFAAWRRKEYAARGLDPALAEPNPGGLVGAIQRKLVDNTRRILWALGSKRNRKAQSGDKNPAPRTGKANARASGTKRKKK